MNICSISFTTYVSKTELISIAGIHATLLAIMMACLIAYVLFAFGNLQTFQMRAISEAEKINEIYFVPYRHGTIKQDEVWNKKELEQELCDIMMGDDNPSTTIKDRATKALGIMNAILGQYPFSNRIFTKDGHYGSRNPADPIIFGDFKDVRKWVKEIDDMTGPLTRGWTIDSENFVNLMVEFCKAESFIQNQEAITNAVNKFPLLSSTFTPILTDPPLSCKDFFSKLIKSRKIMNKTKYFIQQTDSFREKVTSVRSLCFAFVMIGVIFVFGVIFPLTQSSVSSLYLLWIPFIFYGTVYGFLLFKIFKIVMIK